MPPFNFLCVFFWIAFNDFILNVLFNMYIPAVFHFFYIWFWVNFRLSFCSFAFIFATVPMGDFQFMFPLKLESFGISHWKLYIGPSSLAPRMIWDKLKVRNWPTYSSTLSLQWKTKWMNAQIRSNCVTFCRMVNYFIHLGFGILIQYVCMCVCH